MPDIHERFYRHPQTVAAAAAGQVFEKYRKNRILNTPESTLVYLGKVVYFPPLSGQANACTRALL